MFVYADGFDLTEIGADAMVTNYPLPPTLWIEHAKRGAAVFKFAHLEIEPEEFIHYLTKMQKAGFSQSQCVLLIQDDNDISRPVWKNLARAWNGYGGVVEFVLRGTVQEWLSGYELEYLKSYGEIEIVSSLPGIPVTGVISARETELWHPATVLSILSRRETMYRNELNDGHIWKLIRETLGLTDDLELLVVQRSK